MTRIGPLLLLTLMSSSIAAQVLFDKAYYVVGDTSSIPFANHAICEMSDQDLVLVAGAILANGPGAPTSYLLAQRSTSGGQVLWRRRYTGAAGEGFSVAGAVALPDGSLVFHGRGMNGPFAERALFLRTDGDGMPLAANWYTQGATGIRIERSWPVNDSTLLLVGVTEVGGYDAAWWAFADADGMLDTVRYVQTTADTHARFERIASYGSGYLLSGTSTSGDLHGLTVARIDSSGALVWARKLEEATPSEYFGARGAFAADMGGFRVFADSRKQGTSHNDVLMVSMNDAGGLVWQQRITFTTFPGGFPTTDALDAGDNRYWLSGGTGDMGRCSAVIHATGLVYSAWHSAAIPGNQIAIAAIRTSDTALVTLSTWQHPNEVAGDLVPKLTKDLVVPNACGPAALARTAELADLTLYGTWTTGTLSFTTLDLLPDLSSTQDEVMDLLVCLSTGANEVAEEPALTVAPMPTSGPVTISGEAITDVMLFDTSGRVVLTRSFPSTSTATLDVRHLSPGLYQLRVREEGRWLTRKLMKE